MLIYGMVIQNYLPVKGLVSMAEEAIPALGWDQNLDFNAEKLALESNIASVRDRREKTFWALALCQLVNGSRRSEALDGLIQWAHNGKSRQRVRVRKRKDKYDRFFKIPEVVRRYDSIKRGALDLEAEGPDAAAKAYYYFMKSRFSHNTHSLRYAFIGEHADKIPVQLLAKMTGHKRMDQVLHYTQRRAAETKLDDLIK